MKENDYPVFTDSSPNSVKLIAIKLRLTYALLSIDSVTEHIFYFNMPLPLTTAPTDHLSDPKH